MYIYSVFSRYNPPNLLWGPISNFFSQVTEYMSCLLLKHPMYISSSGWCLVKHSAGVSRVSQSLFGLFIYLDLWSTGIQIFWVIFPSKFDNKESHFTICSSIFFRCSGCVYAWMCVFNGGAPFSLFPMVDICRHLPFFMEGFWEETWFTCHLSKIFDNFTQRFPVLVLSPHVCIQRTKSSVKV